MNATKCLHRCELFTYTLIEEPVSASDEELYQANLYLYFGSPNLEVWTEYRLMSLLDYVVSVGGAVGLILGMSVLSVLLVIIKYSAKGLRMMTTNKGHRRRARLKI